MARPTVYDLNHACMAGEHWMVFEYPEHGVPCNFGCHFHARAVSNFLRSKPSQRAVQKLNEIQQAGESTARRTGVR